METRNGKYRETIYYGKIRVHSPFFNRKTDAKEWLAKKKAERAKMQVMGEDYRPQSTKTFEEFAQEWFNTKILNFKSPSTIVDYQRILTKHLTPVIGKKLLREIREKDATTILRSLKDKGQSEKSISDIISIAKQVLGEAERDEEISKNPFRFFKAPKVSERDHSFWTDAEISQFLLSSRESEYYPFFVCAFYTGMRRGEIAGLTWDCIDFQNNLITVKSTRNRYGHRNTTKTGRIRYAPINTFLKNVLLQLFQKRTDATPYVFLYKNEPLDVQHIYRVFQILQEKAGIQNRIRVHDTRHTFASLFMMKGLGTLYDLANILGHSDTKMTQRYAHLSKQHLSVRTENMKFGMEDELFSKTSPIHPTSIVGVALVVKIEGLFF